MTENQIPPCAICQQPMSADELNLNRHYHFDCEVCTVCGQSMSGANTQIQNCIDHGSAVGHTVCLERGAIADLRNKIVPITREAVQNLNNQILTMRYSVTPPTSDITLLSGILQDLQECAANVSWVLKLTKDKIKIDEIREYDTVVKERKSVERKAKAIVAVKEQATAERSAMLQAERVNPWLRARRKSVEAVISIYNCSLQEAEEQVDAGFRAQGKDPRTGLPLSVQ